MLEPCQALDQTVCADAACGLKQDARDRAAHIECQRKDNGLIDYVRHLMAEGVIQ